MKKVSYRKSYPDSAMANYDFFISYKIKKYLEQAKELKKIASSQGYSAWIYIKRPFQTSVPVSKDALTRYLKNAIDSCRYILFFETYATQAMQIGGPSIKEKSWQEQELDMADLKEIIYLYHGASERSIVFGNNSKLYKYRELTDAFEMIKTAITDQGLYLWEK